MSTDQELHAQLTDLLTEHLYDRGANVAQWPEDERALRRELSEGHYDDYSAGLRRLRHEKAAAAILADPGLLDEICEYRARQLNAERRAGVWKSSEEVPLGRRFRSIGFPDSLTWHRVRHGALALPPHGDDRIHSTSVVDRDWGDNGFEAAPDSIGVLDVERFATASGFFLASMRREAAASVALDRDERAQTFSVGTPYPAPGSDTDKPA